MNQTLSGIMAAAMPHDAPAKCPKCGGRILATVALYTEVPVEVTTFPLDRTRRAIYGGKLVATKKALAEQMVENYTGASVDIRDDLYCENYRHAEGEGCDFWTHAVELEGIE